MRRIDILDKGDLIAGGGSLSRNDSRVREKVLPDLSKHTTRQSPTQKDRSRIKTHPEPLLAVLCLDLVLVGEPVAVPAPDGGGVVHADGVDALDLEADALEAADEEPKRRAGVGAGEDVLVHEQAPNQVLVLPAAAQARDLQKEHAVIIQHIVNLLEERREVAHADVLGHLEARDLVVAADGHGDVAVVGADDAALGLGHAVLAQAGVAPGGLVAAERHAGGAGAVPRRGVPRQRPPPAPDVQQRVVGVEPDLLAHHGQLVVLQLLQRLFFVDVADQPARVHHAWPKEPPVEVVAAVVVVAHLLFVLVARVHDHLWQHACQEEPE